MLPTPSVFGSYGHAWRMLWPNFGRFLLIGIVIFLVNLPGGIAQGIFQLGGELSGDQGLTALGQLIGWVYSVFVGIPIGYGGWYAALRAVRGETPMVEDIFAPFKGAYWRSILSNLIVIVLVTCGLILLVIPGIYVALKLAWVPMLVVDERLGAWESIRESWRRTGGHWWRILGVALVAISVFIVGLVLFVVGVIPAVMLIWLAAATLYASVTHHKGATVG